MSVTCSLRQTRLTFPDGEELGEMLAASVVKPESWFERRLRCSRHLVLFFRTLLAMGTEELTFADTLPGSVTWEVRHLLPQMT